MNATPEEWRPVVDWEGYYEVSNHGRIRTVARVIAMKNGVNRHSPSRIRRQGDHHLGYKIICLTGGDRRTTKHVHSLVLTAFVGPRPTGLVACHNDGNPANNHLENLRWDTQSNNLLDAVQQGTHPLAAATKCQRGHEFTPENTYFRGNGWRLCRQCALDSQKRSRQKNRV